MKTIEIMPTANKDWGFWGTSKVNGYDVELTWAAASRFLATEFELTPEQVRNVLDARFGRHLANDLSFIENGEDLASGPISTQAVTNHFKTRVADKGWRDSFENAIREATGKTFPRKEPISKDDLFTLLAQTHLGVETLVTRHSDGLDFHDVAVWGIKAALEAAYEAGRKGKK